MGQGQPGTNTQEGQIDLLLQLREAVTWWIQSRLGTAIWARAYCVLVHGRMLAGRLLSPVQGMEDIWSSETQG